MTTKYRNIEILKLISLIKIIKFELCYNYVCYNSLY